MSDFSTELHGHTLEFIDNCHTYLVDGIIVPSVTQIMKVRYNHKYSGIPKKVLNKAADRGTKVHQAIQEYCELRIMSDLPEVRNFKFLKKQYGFKVLANEAPVIIFDRHNGFPICAGRLDLVLEMNGKIGGADIKRTSKLDKEYLAYQLNLYRIGYSQCYGVTWEFLKGVHLREEVRKFVDIPINEDMAWGLIKKYYQRFENEENE